MNIFYNTYYVTIPDPITEDILRFSTQAVKRIMPHGQLKSFKDANWPVVETAVYDIYRLKEDQKDDFIALVNAAAGKEITIENHLRATITGYIVTPVNEILTTRDSCWYDIHFEFMINHDIINILGDCHNNPVVDIPEPGDSDYVATLDNYIYYLIQSEGGTIVYDEDGVTELFSEEKED